MTHSHPDHIGAARGITHTTGCFVAAHQGEKNWIEDVDLQARERPVPGFHTLVQGSVKVDRVLNDGDVVQADDLRIQVIHTPGHSEGSISLLLREQGVLFTGDAVPVPGDMPVYEDALASAASVQKLRGIAGIKMLLASWDSPRSDEAAYETLDKGLGYLERINQAVIRVAGKTGLDPMVLCGEVLRELNLPAGMANPIVANSFQANLRQCHRQELHD